MSNSSLVTYAKASPNNSGKRSGGICRITPHCVVGQVSAKWIGDYFANSSVEASCNYGIGTEIKVCFGYVFYKYILTKSIRHLLKNPL